MFLISVEGPRRRKVEKRERDYEVLENINSTCEECEESTLIKRKNASFFRRKESENVKNIIKWEVERICT